MVRPYFSTPVGGYSSVRGAEDKELRRARLRTKRLVIASLAWLVPALGLAGGQYAVIANRSDQYSQLHAHGVSVPAVITDCPTQVTHDNSNNSNTFITTCNATFFLRGTEYQETILGVSGAVDTPEHTTLIVNPNDPTVDYLASDVRNGSGTGVGSFFTSILGIFALVWFVVWLLFAVPAWRRWWERHSASITVPPVRGQAPTAPTPPPSQMPPTPSH
jgi:hypothetical protein